MSKVYAECRYDESNHTELKCHKYVHYAECRYAECNYVKCRYAECWYAECRSAENWNLSKT